MKIRKINSSDIFQYVHQPRRFHKKSMTDLHIFDSTLKQRFIRSQRASMEIKLLKQKILSRKERRKENSSISFDQLKTMAIYQNVKFFYSKLSELYLTNYHKLFNTLVNHIKNQHYIFSKQLYEMLRNFKTNKPNSHICLNAQPKKMFYELSKFKEYLQSFYEKKCIKQIDIMEQNIIQREEAIREQTSLQTYKKITKSFRPSLISNNIDIGQQFKVMSQQNGEFKQLSKVQTSLFKRMRQTQQRISRVFQSVCTSKEKDKFLFHIQEIQV